MRSLQTFICFTLIVIDRYVSGSANHFSLTLTLNTTWGEFCPRLNTFKNSVSSYATKKLSIVIQNDQVLLKDLKCGETCYVSDHVTLKLLLVHPPPKTDTLHMTWTKRMSAHFYSGQSIGAERVVNASLETSSPPKVVMFSIDTIGYIVGVVIAVYLLGYFLILKTRSYGTISGSDDKPIAFLINQRRRTEAIVEIKQINKERLQAYMNAAVSENNSNEDFTSKSQDGYMETYD